MKLKTLAFSAAVAAASFNAFGDQPVHDSPASIRNRVVIESDGGRTIIGDSMYGVGNRIVIDGEEIGVGTTEVRPPGSSVLRHREFWRQRVLNSVNGLPNPYHVRPWNRAPLYQVPTKEERVEVGARLNELVQDPIVRKHVPPHVLELLESLAAEHSVVEEPATELPDEGDNQDE